MLLVHHEADILDLQGFVGKAVDIRPYCLMLSVCTTHNEDKPMTYDVIYQLRGDKYLGRVLRTVTAEADAFDLCRDLSNFPADTIHYAIIREDGTTIYDTTKDPIL